MSALPYQIADQSVQGLISSVSYIVIVTAEQRDTKGRSIHFPALKPHRRKGQGNRLRLFRFISSKERFSVMSDPGQTTLFRKGQRVRWNWGTGVGHGKVTDRFERHVERTIESAKVSRNGSQSNPAYLISTDAGGQVLKLGSELQSV
ncbi:DUF2945 domain-containing protein [Sphingobium sp. BS19]|uniref:DUF2945 domain-containing protein n=2 Tax=unclassified Sphingobium TaxID=2611147 RepID=UPI002852B9EB|nr:DUF2945 domain-containing protein [Sphingobium sp. BS19]